MLTDKNSIYQAAEESEAAVVSDFGEKTGLAKELIEAKVYLGHRSSRTNPKMEPYIAGTKNGVEIIDLEKTAAFLEKAEAMMKEASQNGKIAMFVGTNPIIRDLIKEAGDKTGCPFTNEKWIGGFLTNFKIVFGRVKYFRDLQEKQEKGELQKYTKKERIVFQKQIEKMARMFSGLENCWKLPDLLVVVNPKLHDTAVKEAIRIKIPIIAITDTDSDPSHIDCIIPAADHIRTSVSFVINRLVNAYGETKIDSSKINVQ